MSVEEHCKLSGGCIFEDFHCSLTLVDNESDKFYIIQLLCVEGADKYFVYNRWGRNGTSGQTKLDGPMDFAKAEKSFKQKFKDKTKNSWESRSCFVPAKGKYKMITDDQQSVSEASKQATTSGEFFAVDESDHQDTFPGIILPAAVFYQIMFTLTTKDVLRCMQVCKCWKMWLSDKYFWKQFANNNFDLSLTTDFEDEHPFCQWRSTIDDCPNGCGWFPYYDDQSKLYVMDPFPSIWNCRIIHPFGLDPFNGDLKSLQGFSRSLEILTHMRNKARSFDIASGNQCSGSEGCDDICVVLFPWKKKGFPDTKTLLTKIFKFHPEIYEVSKKGGEKTVGKLFYHIPHEEEDSEIEDHDIEEKPCLNRIFGLISPDEASEAWYKDVKEFYEWLHHLMVPTLTVYVGVDKLNPVVVFFITNLAPGWVGGVLTGVGYT